VLRAFPREFPNAGFVFAENRVRKRKQDVNTNFLKCYQNRPDPSSVTLSAGMHTNLEAARNRVGPLGLDVRNGRLDCGFDVNRHVGEDAQVYPRGSEA